MNFLRTTMSARLYSEVEATLETPVRLKSGSHIRHFDISPNPYRKCGNVNWPDFVISRFRQLPIENGKDDNMTKSF